MFPPGPGRSVTMPYEQLRQADADAGGDPRTLITALQDRGLALQDAQELAGMFAGQQACGQLGAQRVDSDRRVRRAGRVVAFYETDAGRYLLQLGTGSDGRVWATIAPANNDLLVERLRELVAES